MERSQRILMDRMESYLTKWVKALLEEGQTLSEIIQQLSALDSKKKIEKLIQDICTESPTPA